MIAFRRLPPAQLVDERRSTFGKPVVWTRKRLSTLDALVSQGLTDQQIARRMGVTATAAKIARRRRLGAPAGRTLLWTAHRVARLFGIDGKTVIRWMQRGWLPASRGASAGPSRIWQTTEETLTAFIENPAFWHLWTPERMTETLWRDWATEIRSERYLSTGEVGDRLGVYHKTVRQWISKGELPAVKHGANWRIPERALAGFVIPADRSKAGKPRRPYSTVEERAIPVLRAAGFSWRDIGALLGRSRTHLAQAWGKEAA